MKTLFGVWQKTHYLLMIWLAELLYIASGGQFPDPDLWGRLSIGALIVETGRFPYHDLFSFTAPAARWVDHEWLTGLVLYGVLKTFGEGGFVAFYALLLLGISALIFRLHSRVYKVSPLWAFYGLLLTIGVYSTGFYSSIRSHVFSFFFYALFLLALEANRLTPDRWRRLLWLIPVGIVWGNMHGGLAMGLILLACYGIGTVMAEQRWKAALPCAGVGVGILGGLSICNPYGPSYLGFLWHAWTLDRQHVGEWTPLQLNRWDFLPAQVLVALTLIVLLWQLSIWLKNRQNGKTWPLNLALLSMAAMTLKAVRMEPFLAFTAVAYAPIIFSNVRPCLSDCWERVAKLQNATIRSVFSTTLPFFLGLGALAGLLYMHSTLDLTRLILVDELTKTDNHQIRYPVGMIEALKKSGYHGNLMVRFDLGEFAYWNLYPQFKVSLDGRYEEVYTQAQFLHNQYFYDRKDLIRAQNSEATLAHDQIDYLLTEPHLPSTAVLLADKQWRVIGGNDYFLLFANLKRVKGPVALANLPMSLPLKTRSIRDFFPSKGLLTTQKLH